MRPFLSTNLGLFLSLHLEYMGKSWTQCCMFIWICLQRLKFLSLVLKNIFWSNAIYFSRSFEANFGGPFCPNANHTLKDMHNAYPRAGGPSCGWPIEMESIHEYRCRMGKEPLHPTYLFKRYVGGPCRLSKKRQYSCILQSNLRIKEPQTSLSNNFVNCKAHKTK